jgi:hypothetical protein
MPWIKYDKDNAELEPGLYLVSNGYIAMELQWRGGKWLTLEYVPTEILDITHYYIFDMSDITTMAEVS